MKRSLALLTACVSLITLFTGCGVLPSLLTRRALESTSETEEFSYDDVPYDNDPDTSPYDEYPDDSPYGSYPDDYPYIADYPYDDYPDDYPEGPYPDIYPYEDEYPEDSPADVPEEEPSYSIQLADWANVEWKQYSNVYFTLMIPSDWDVEWSGNAEQMMWIAKSTTNSMLGMSNLDHNYAAKDPQMAGLLGMNMSLQNGTVQEYFETMYAPSTDYFTVENSCVPANKETLAATRTDKAIWDYQALYATFSENGVEGEGIYSAVIMEAPDLILTGGYNYAIWEINGTFTEWAPRGELVGWIPVMSQIAQSFTYTDLYWQEWASQWGSGETPTSSGATDTDPIMEAFEERMTEDTILQEKRSDMIGEYERVYDNDTGNIYRAYDGFLDDLGSDQTRWSAVTDSQYADGYVGWIDRPGG